MASEHPSGPQQPGLARRTEYLNYGMAIRLLRIGRQMSQLAVSNVMHVSRRHLTKLEINGITPTLGTIERLENALGVPHGSVIVVASALYRKAQ